MSVRILVGNALDRLRELPDESVHCVVTSPPYWGLRDYGTATWDGGDPECKHAGRPKPRQDTTGSGVDHGRFAGTRGTQDAKAIHTIPVKDVCSCGARRVDDQLGLERTPEEYVAKMVAVFEDVRRVLRRDGTLWLNIGDCYTDGGRGADVGSTLGGTRDNQRECRNVRVREGATTGLRSKNLVGMPSRTFLGWIVVHRATGQPLVGFYCRRSIAAKSYALEKLNLVRKGELASVVRRTWRTKRVRAERRKHGLVLRRVYCQ